MRQNVKPHFYCYKCDKYFCNKDALKQHISINKHLKATYENLVNIALKTLIVAKSIFLGLCSRKSIICKQQKKAVLQIEFQTPLKGGDG